ILFEHRFQHLQARPDRELEQLTARIDEQIDQRKVARRFNSGGTEDCARLSHGGSCSVRLSPRVWSPLVYHEQRPSPRFNFQQLSGHPHMWGRGRFVGWVARAPRSFDRNRARTRDAGDADSGGERLLAIAERRDGWRAVAFIKTPRAKDLSRIRGHAEPRAQFPLL